MGHDIAQPQPLITELTAAGLHLCRAGAVAGNALTLFLETPPLVEALLQDIRSATRRVWLETYIFLQDRVGQQIAAALAERARAGVDVRVLYDALGSQTTPTAFFRKLTRAGVKVHRFHSFAEALSRLSMVFQILNRRNHRKLVVIDDRVAYFGGMNIVDTSSLPDVGKVDRLLRSAGWRDVHVRLEGPQQAEVAESFERVWLRAHHQKVKRRPRAYRRGFLAGGAESIQFFDSGPGLRNSRAARVFLRLIRSARHSIRLSMAYFLPVGRVLRALFHARRRGVRIEVVVPGDSDVKLVQYATQHLYQRLLKRGFHIWERQSSMLHGKVMVVDEQWTVVGSCNLDARSLWINHEFLAVIHSQSVARLMNDIINYEMQHSRRVTLQEWSRQGWGIRLLSRLAWGLRWWL